MQVVAKKKCCQWAVTREVSDTGEGALWQVAKRGASAAAVIEGHVARAKVFAIGRQSTGEGERRW